MRAARVNTLAQKNSGDASRAVFQTSRAAGAPWRDAAVEVEAVARSHELLYAFGACRRVASAEEGRRRAHSEEPVVDPLVPWR
eukprot:CAMPEP_0119355552 /NCGR_PEP_ID=MMETSP1334-20130426/4358_1 /TAXON_ID=127549 /ORGANISM="Calcidiscus leptoporus, Strain RCC1130" /LENGTH=82 /DNA_ID=CAMNT_0007369395 /DNA_START=200 /DNA_END=448 /DNA_ORIENTATION=-